MKVLVACEFSGTVRDEFIKQGHDAVSCDLLPSESDKGRHIQGDVLDVINSENFDLLIAHPPCTYLSVVGNKWFRNNPERERERDKAFKFAMTLYNAPISKICMENPMGYINSHFRKPDQIIHPYMFGDHEMKRTCLWLKKLPKLYWSFPYAKKPEPKWIRHTNKGYGKRIYFTESCIRVNDSERWKVRSKTFPGIAHAMAVQWGSEKTQYFTETYGGN